MYKTIGNKLLTQSKIDLSFSGSTCVSLYFTKDKYFCANLGDSRAFMGKKTKNGWRAASISKDHKPSIPS